MCQAGRETMGEQVQILLNGGSYREQLGQQLPSAVVKHVTLKKIPPVRDCGVIDPWAVI